MRNNSGMTLIGMVLTITILTMAGIVLMRAIPVYLQHYAVNRAISALKTLPKSDFSTDPSANSSILRDKLMNQFYINNIEISGEHVTIKPNGRDHFRVSVKYQVIRPLVGNISLLFDFDESQEVNIGGE